MVIATLRTSGRGQVLPSIEGARRSVTVIDDGVTSTIEGEREREREKRRESKRQ